MPAWLMTRTGSACSSSTTSLAGVPRPRLRPDLSAFRDSRDLRLVVGGTFIADLGVQATLVALPYQLYVLTRSAFLVGLLGAVELGPLITVSLLGGVLADRMDRRRLLLAGQAGGVLGAGALTAVAAGGHPAVGALYGLAAVLAGCNALINVAQTAIIPNLVNRSRLPRALAVSYGLYALTMVLGPGLGGLLITGFGVAAAYAVTAACGLPLVAAAMVIGRQPPPGALFVVLAVGVFHAGAAGTGVLYASVSAGATVAALLTGWINHARRLGLIVIWAVAVWGAAVALAGLMNSLWPAAALLAVARAADSVSAVCSSTINQTITPDRMRGRMSAVFSLVVSGGPRVGDLESGTVAGVAGVRLSFVSGGLFCLAGVAVIALAFPALARYDTADWVAEEAAAPAG